MLVNSPLAYTAEPLSTRARTPLLALGLHPGATPPRGESPVLGLWAPPGAPPGRGIERGDRVAHLPADAGEGSARVDCGSAHREGKDLSTGVRGPSRKRQFRGH